MDGISTRHVRAIVYASRLLGWGAAQAGLARRPVIAAKTLTDHTNEVDFQAEPSSANVVHAGPLGVTGRLRQKAPLTGDRSSSSASAPP